MGFLESECMFYLYIWDVKPLPNHHRQCTHPDINTYFSTSKYTPVRCDFSQILNSILIVSILYSPTELCCHNIKIIDKATWMLLRDMNLTKKKALRNAMLIEANLLHLVSFSHTLFLHQTWRTGGWGAPHYRHYFYYFYYFLIFNYVLYQTTPKSSGVSTALLRISDIIVYFSGAVPTTPCSEGCDHTTASPLGGILESKGRHTDRKPLLTLVPRTPVPVNIGF